MLFLIYIHLYTISVFVIDDISLYGCLNSFDMVIVKNKKKINILAQNSCNFDELNLKEHTLYEPVFKTK